MRNIITISREFGSGGREIGKRLAEILQIPYYDNEIITELAQRTQLAEEYVRQFAETGAKSINYFPITMGRTFTRQIAPKQMQVLNLQAEQSKLLGELAEKSDCVIVGRSAGFILREYNPLRVFVYANMTSKLKRCREKAPNENMTDKELVRHIENVDKGRAQYYKMLTGHEWDNKFNYDVLINTSHYPPKLAAQMLSQVLVYDRKQE